MGVYHPQIVHFAIALVFVGVGFRLVSLTRRLPFTGTAAPILIWLGTLACFAAAYTGVLAHGPVERVPGARPAVVEHEEWGLRARNVFLIVSIIELAALLTARRQQRIAYKVAVTAAVAGVVGLGVMYETAAHGGDLVYRYAGGVGIRSGEAEDINRLFIAGAFHQATQDRDAGRNNEAMELIELAAARFPSNLELRLTAIEWTTDVKKDPVEALSRLDALQIPSDDTRGRVRAGLARAAALTAQGNATGAKAVLQTLLGEFPGNAQITRRLNELSAQVP